MSSEPTHRINQPNEPAPEAEGQEPLPPDVETHPIPPEAPPPYPTAHEELPPMGHGAEQPPYAAPFGQLPPMRCCRPLTPCRTRRRGVCAPTLLAWDARPALAGHAPADPGGDRRIPVQDRAVHRRSGLHPGDRDRVFPDEQLQSGGDGPAPRPGGNAAPARGGAVAPRRPHPVRRRHRRRSLKFAEHVHPDVLLHQLTKPPARRHGGRVLGLVGRGRGGSGEGGLVGRWQSKSSDFYQFNQDGSGSRGKGTRRGRSFNWTITGKHLNLYFSRTGPERGRAHAEVAGVQLRARTRSRCSCEQPDGRSREYTLVGS